MNWTLAIGSVVIVGVILLIEEREKREAASASATSQQAASDASVWAVEGQGNEITNISPGGSAANVYFSEAPAGASAGDGPQIYNTNPTAPTMLGHGITYNAQGVEQAPVA